MEFAFGNGAVAEKAGGDDVFATHVIGQRHPDRERQPTADNGISAVEIGRPVEQVHGAAPPAAATLLLAKHLGENRRHRHAADQRLAMLAIGRHNPVALLQDRYYPDRDRLFAVVKVQKSADLLQGVKLSALFLETADADHLLQEVKRMRP